MREGFIKSLKLGQNFCFIAVLHGGDVFCHRTQLAPSLEWDDSLLNRRVTFRLERDARGERAVAVHPAD